LSAFPLMRARPTQIDCVRKLANSLCRRAKMRPVSLVGAQGGRRGGLFGERLGIGDATSMAHESRWGPARKASPEIGLDAIIGVIACRPLEG
jgi:hypothetical protein